jgi:hypothetical protein
MPANHSLSQPTISQQIYRQNALIYASQPQNSIPIINPVQLHNVEQTFSLNSENQQQKVSRKRYRNMDDQENENAKKQELGGPIPTTNRFSTLSEENVEEAAKQSTEPKPPSIFISGVTNIKPLIELLNEIAADKYLVKTLYNDQVTVQPAESSVYTTVVKALMEKYTEFHTYKPRQERNFRVVLKNILPPAD